MNPNQKLLTAICAYLPHGLYFYDEKEEQYLLLQSVVDNKYLIFHETEKTYLYCDGQIKPVLYTPEDLGDSIYDHGTEINPFDLLVTDLNPDNHVFVTADDPKYGGFIMFSVETGGEPIFHAISFDDYYSLIKWKYQVFSLESYQYLAVENLETNPYEKYRDI